MFKFEVQMHSSMYQKLQTTMVILVQDLTVEILNLQRLARVLQVTYGLTKLKLVVRLGTRLWKC